jgi:hypothetical protein
MDELETRKRKVLQPLLVEAGAALMDCQAFEYGISLLLFQFSRMGVVGLDPQKLSAVMENTDKKTAGQLIALLKQHLRVSEGISEALTAALAARNQLIHRVLIDNIEMALSPRERRGLVRRIRHLRSQVQKADRLLRPFTMGFSAALDGYRQEDTERQFRAMLGNADAE